MGRMANSWETTKQSWGVLKKDKELVIFPVLSGLASLAVIASFVAPTWFSGLIDQAVVQEDPNAQNALFVVYFLMYLVLAFVTVYFTSALIFAADERLAGGDPTIRSGLRGANAHLGRIFAWAMFAGTVSFLIHILEQATRGRGQFVSHLIVQFVGAAWALATYFAIPVVLFEQKGVGGSLKRSGQLFRQRWGESLVGQYGISFVFGIFTIVTVFVTGALFYVVAGAPGVGIYLAFLVLAAGVLAVLFLSITGLALGGIYKAALYRFAKSGEVPPGFEPRIIEGAYRPTAGTV